MGLLKNARQQGREAGLADAPSAPPPSRAYFSLRGVRFTKYRAQPDLVNVTRLAANDPGTWQQVWHCIKRSRPHLAALLMYPQFAALQAYFDCDALCVDFRTKPEVDMVNEAYYIDTRDGANGPFTPPPKVEDYAGWVRAQYAACQGQDGNKTAYFGLAQRVNALVAQARHALEQKEPAVVVRIIGPHAEALRVYLDEVSGGVVTVEVVL